MQGHVENATKAATDVVKGLSGALAGLTSLVKESTFIRGRKVAAVHTNDAVAPVDLKGN